MNQTKYSRRFTCKHCGHRGRVSKSARAKYIKCPACKKTTKTNKMKTDKEQLIESGCQNLWIGSTIMGWSAESLYFQRGDYGKDPRDESLFNDGFPFRIWRDSGIGYATGRSCPEHTIDGQAKSVAEAIEKAGEDGVIVMQGIY